MGNSRGNKYSRKHKTLNPDHPLDRDKYWSFSFHEVGVYDLPGMIDHILTKTGHSQLNYIGHSQGTTAFFVMCSESPEYNRKVSSMQAFCPAAYLNHMTSPAGYGLAPFLFPYSVNTFSFIRLTKLLILAIEIFVAI